MERNTFNISFYVQKTRVAKNGEVPVVMRVTINGQRIVTSVNLKVDPKKWNAAAGNISFYVQKTRVAKNGEVPVMLRVTVNGLRAEASVNLKEAASPGIIEVSEHRNIL